MPEEEYRIIIDPRYGYRRLDQLPTDEEIGLFYKKQYFDLIRQGARAPEIRRFLAGGKEAERERNWLCCMYSDILSVLEQQNSFIPKTLLDLGCGTGDFIAFMKDNGWQVTGLDVSSEGATLATDKGLTIFDLDIKEFIATHREYLSSFAVVSLLNVLEHVPNPAETVNIAKKLLVDGGMIVIRVPNDFSELQLLAQKNLQKEPWWITIPDHLNYFDFKSLSSLLEQVGFEIIYSQGDFPMELFLLMGDDYTGDPEVGNICHQKRVNFEMAVTGEFRRLMYRALATVGIGRDCLTFGRLKKR